MDNWLIELVIRAPFAGVLVYVIWVIYQIQKERNCQDHERFMALIEKLPGREVSNDS